MKTMIVFVYLFAALDGCGMGYNPNCENKKVGEFCDYSKPAGK